MKRRLCNFTWHYAAVKLKEILSEYYFYMRADVTWALSSTSVPMVFNFQAISHVHKGRVNIKRKKNLTEI